MRRAAAVLCLCCLALPAVAQQRRAAPPTVRGGPPHAWLFGTWTGGLFPVLDGMAAQDCKTQPTVVFGQDVVAHQTLLAGTVQQAIETVRDSPAGAEFRFVPNPRGGGGFGCESDDVLHVTRGANLNEIGFPHCAAFPYPLRRC